MSLTVNHTHPPFFLLHTWRPDWALVLSRRSLDNDNSFSITDGVSQNEILMYYCYFYLETASFGVLFYFRDHGRKERLKGVSKA